MSEIDEKEIKLRFEAISQFELSPEVTARDLERVRKMLTEQTSGQRTREQKMWRTIMKSPITKYAAVIALICMVVVAAAVVGIKYHYIEQDEKGRHFVQNEDGRNTFVFAENHADSPEQAVSYAEEIALLKQQGNRELVGVSEIEVNGQHDSRHLTYKYNLSDGRTLKVGERDPDDDGPRTLTSEQREELRQLWHEQLRQQHLQDLSTTKEKQVYGSVFSFTKWKLVLSDGTEVTYSIGRLK
jgi:hypothetical protein